MKRISSQGSVTLKDLAEYAGVSIPTISRHLNKSGYVGKDARRKVQESIERLNYYPNAIAQSLRQRKSMSIGLALEYIGYGEKAFFSSIVSGLADAVGRKGYSLQFVETSPESAKRKQGLYYLDKVRGRSLDGLVIVDSCLPEEDFLQLRQYGTPFVVVDRLVEQLSGRCILADFRLMGYRLARFLLDRGHRRIAYFGTGEMYTETVHTIEGIRRALDEYGAQLHDEDVVFYTAGGGRSIIGPMVRILSREDAPTAAICGILTETLAQLIQRGLKVREGFEFAGRLCSPEEVVCRQFVYAVKTKAVQLGQGAGQLLLDLLAGKGERSEPVNVGVGEFSRPTCDLEAILKQIPST